MRILFCNYEYPPLGGGGGVLNALLAQELATGHEVTVLTSQGRGLPSESVAKGVRVVRVPVFFRRHEAVANTASMLAFMLLGIKVGKKLLRAERFDVINTHFALPTGPVGDALARYAGIPNVLTLHGGDLYDPSKAISPHRHIIFRAWIRRLIRRSSLVVGQSINTLENMHRFYTPEIEAALIPLGIRRPQVAASSRERYGFSQADTLLVTIGRLIRRKAISQLILMMEAFRHSPVRLLIIGSGPQESVLRQKVKTRRIEDNVKFLGQIDEVEKFQLLQISDLYVSTSQHEGFGLVFLEAMASGLPIVCYDCGGQTDFLQDRETGFLVSLNDLDAFRNQCMLLINNGELRKVMGERNRCRAEEFYIDRCALRYDQTFRNALANDKKAVPSGIRAMLSESRRA